MKAKEVENAPLFLHPSIQSIITSIFNLHSNLIQKTSLHQQFTMAPSATDPVAQTPVGVATVSGPLGIESASLRGKVALVTGSGMFM